MALYIQLRLLRVARETQTTRRIYFLQLLTHTSSFICMVCAATYGKIIYKRLCVV